MACKGCKDERTCPEYPSKSQRCGVYLCKLATEYTNSRDRSSCTIGRIEKGQVKLKNFLIALLTTATRPSIERLT